MMDTFPDLGSLSDQELKDLIQQLTEEEQEVSYRRRILHGKIDILRAELVNRLRKKHEGGEDGDHRRRRPAAHRHPRRPGRVGRRRATSRAEAAGWRATAPSAASSTPRARTTARSAARSSARLRPTQRRRRRPPTLRHRRARPASSSRSTSSDVAARGRRAGDPLRRRARRARRSRCAGERMTIGRSPDAEVFLDDVTVSRNHALLVRRGGDWYLDDSRLAQRHLRQPPADRVAPARGRRRAAGRQVQADLPRPLSEPDATDADDDPLERRRRAGAPAKRQKSLTIGAVCKALAQEFPDISISKIRYLEDQKLLTPRRTPGRLPALLAGRRGAPAHDPAPPARRVPAAAGDPPGAGGRPRRARTRRRRRRRRAGRRAARRRALRRLTCPRDRGALYSLEDVVEETGAEPRLVSELEEYGVIKGERRGGDALYDETEREIIRAVTELARYGVGGRNLRVFRTSADREAALLEQILAPALRSRNPERRKEAVEALENLAAIASHLKHLLLIRDLRKIARSDASRDLRGADPRHPGLPRARDRVQGHHAAVARPAALRARSTRLADWRAAAARSTTSSRPRRAASSSARAGARARRRLRPRPQARQAARRDRRGRVHARVRRRRARGARRRARRRRARAASTTTCWPPAARRGALCELVEQPARRSCGCALPDRAGVPRRAASGSRGYDVHALVAYDGE